MILFMTLSAPPALALTPAGARPDLRWIWYHAAFCRMALPFSSSVGSWRHAVDDTALTIEMAMPDQTLPSGWCLRRLLMHLCDKAVRTGNPVLELGPDIAALALEMGLPAMEPVLQELGSQLEHLAAAKVSLTWGEDHALAVFDARGQRRRPEAVWRPRLRLSGRFLASLMQHAVPLERQIVAALMTEALALDAHGWIRQVLHHQPAGQAITVPWPELLDRFGSPHQDPKAFREAFEDALRVVFAADHSISLAADEDGITVGFALDAEAGRQGQRPPREKAAGPAPGSSPVASSPSSQKSAVHPASRQGSPSVSPLPAHGGSQPIGLRSCLTGLPGMIWLRRGQGDEPPVVAVTPGTRFEPDRMTLLTLEPLVLQISGGLQQAEYTRVSAWIMANRDLIDLVWEGEISTLDQATARVRKAPASDWR
jgi:hypothetical protein